MKRESGLTRRIAGFFVALFSIFAILAASLLFAGSSTRAAAPPVAANPSGVGAVSPARLAPPPVAPKPGAPAVSSWTDIAPFPNVTIDYTPSATPLKLKRAGAAAYPANGKVYVLGGRHGTDGEDINMQKIFEYTPGSPGTWITKTALLDSSSPGSRYTANMAVAVLTDTNGPRIYAIGGNSINSEPIGTVRVYDPLADSLTTLSADVWPASPARIPGGYAVYNNKLYIFGGFSALGSGSVYAETWVFDPLGVSGSKWTHPAGADLPFARGYIAGAQIDGKIYAIGGDTWTSSSRSLNPVANVDVLDPAQPGLGWTARAALPSARGDMSAWAYNTGTGYEISGSIVVAGGVYPMPDGKAFRYNPAGNSWNSFPSLAHATRNYAAAQLNGLLYAFGGYDYSNNIPAGGNFNQRYDATGSVPTATNTPLVPPTATSTPINANYNICQFTGVSLVPGTTLVAGSQCDDCYTTVSLPFPYQLYDQTFTTAKLAANGTIGFLFAESNLVNTCLPDQAANYAIYAYWDDLLLTGASNGIYTSITGSAPNRVYNIEWRGTKGGAGVNFEVRLYEGQTKFDIIYAAVVTGGNSATVGVQKDSGSLFNQFSCNTSALSAGLQLTFDLNSGSCPSPTSTFTSTNTPTRTPTVTGTPPTATATSTPTATPCGPATNYVITQGTGAIVPGTGDTGNHADDGVTTIALPFTVQLYGQSFSNATVSSNGNLQFSSSNGAYANACLPQSSFNNTIFANWDDLRTDGTGDGVFTSVTGIAPNRILNVEWRATYFNGGAVANFEVRLYEGQDRFDLVYGQTDGGGGATVGVQNGTGTVNSTEFECNTGGLTSGLLLTFTQPPCSTPVATVTPGGPTFTSTPTGTPTNTPTRTFTQGALTNTPTGTATATAVCGTGGDYAITQSTGAAIVAGTTDVGNHCDDCTSDVTLPFSYNLYGQSFVTATLGSNGIIGFLANGNAYANACLPYTAANYAIFPNWDDLRTDGTGGIFTSVSGVTPNRIFNIEWRATYYNGGATANFEVRLYEGQSRFDVIFGQTDGGAGTTVGVQKDTGSRVTQFECNTGGITLGLLLTFTQLPCASPTATITPGGPTISATPSATRTGTRTRTPTVTLTPTIMLTATRTSTPSLQWRVFGPVPTGNDLRDVYMVNSDDGWAVGDAGTVLHYDGANWNAVNIGTTDTLVDVYMVSAVDGYILGWKSDGSGSHIFHYDGTTWNIVYTGTVGNDLYRTDALASNNVWVVGNNGTILHYDGSTWTQVPINPSTTLNLRAIDMLSASEGWAVGQLGLILHYTGGSWNQSTSPSTVTLLDCVFTSPSDGWAPGLASPSFVDHYDGVAWTQSYPNNEGIYRLHMFNATEGWGIASNVIDHYTGGAFTPVNNPTANTLYSIYMVSTTDGWIVGASGTILHYYDSLAPTRTPSATPQSYLVGHVTWQGHGTQPNALQQLPITLTLKLGATEVNYPTMTTDASGYFTVSLAGLPSGTYNWRAKGPLFLANSGSVAFTGAPVTNLEMGLMLVGDSNNDNVINVTDFGIMRASFGKASGDPGYDSRADLNGDTRVNATDFNLQRANFGQSGAGPLSPGALLRSNK